MPNKFKQVIKPRAVIAIVSPAGRMWMDVSHEPESWEHGQAALLLTGTHQCKPLQEDWNRLGGKGFEFRVVWQQACSLSEVRRQRRKAVRLNQPEYNSAISLRGTILATARAIEGERRVEGMVAPIEIRMPVMLEAVLDRRVVIRPGDPRWLRLIAMVDAYWFEICEWEKRKEAVR